MVFLQSCKAECLVGLAGESREAHAFWEGYGDGVGGCPSPSRLFWSQFPPSSSPSPPPTQPESACSVSSIYPASPSRPWVMERMNLWSKRGRCFHRVPICWGGGGALLGSGELKMALVKCLGGKRNLFFPSKLRLGGREGRGK